MQEEERIHQLPFCCYKCQLSLDAIDDSASVRHVQVNQAAARMGRTSRAKSIGGADRMTAGFDFTCAMLANASAPLAAKAMHPFLNVRLNIG